MRSTKNNPIRSALGLYLGWRHSHQLTTPSLHQIWRSVGSPSSMTPRRWTEYAHELLKAMGDYQAIIYGAHFVYGKPRDDDWDPTIDQEVMDDLREVTWPYTPEAGQMRGTTAGGFAGPDSIQVGDTMAIHEVAVLYCLYLDDKDLEPVEERARPRKKTRKPLESGDEPIIKMVRAGQEDEDDE